MTKFFRLLLVVLITTIATQTTQAQMKPIVIDEQLRNRYSQFKSDIDGAKDREDAVADQIAKIRKAVPGQESDVDIKEIVDPLRNQLEGIKRGRQEGLLGIKAVEDSIKKIIRDAKVIPVVWRTYSAIPFQRLTTETYVIQDDKIVIISSTIELKDEKY